MKYYINKYSIKMKYVFFKTLYVLTLNLDKNNKTNPVHCTMIYLNRTGLRMIRTIIEIYIQNPIKTTQIVPNFNFDTKIALILMQICPKEHQKSASYTPLQKIDANKVPKRYRH